MSIINNLRKKRIPKDKLDAISEELRIRHPHLHKGGCGRLAAIMHEELKKKGIQSEIKVLQSKFSVENAGNVDINTIPKLHLWAAVAFDHVVVKVGRNYFDNLVVTSRKSMMENESFKMAKGSLSINKLKYVNRVGDWNKQFDVQEVPAIKKLIKKHLKDL